MAKRILLINGPNLNLLGQREPQLYGADTLADVEARCTALAEEHGATLQARQSNSEGQIVDWVQDARSTADGIIINPGAYSHTSIAILDALNAFEGPVMEVHISNIHQRETFRHTSYVSLRANGIIVGCGVQGYELAMLRCLTLLG